MPEGRFTKREDIRTLTRKYFEPIALAGSGTAADVWFCVRVKGVSGNDEKPFCTVKVAAPHKRDTLRLEVEALKYFRLLPESVQPHYQKLLDYHRPKRASEDLKWMRTGGIVGFPVSLLIPTIQSQPALKPLVLQIALQLCNALQAMRDSNPPLKHGDIHPANIMLNIERRGDNVEPTVVMIDFAKGGRAEPKDLDFDRDRFFTVVADLALHQHPGAQNDGGWWNAFVKYFVDGRQLQNRTPMFEDFRTRFEDFARRSWNQMSANDRSVVEGILSETSRATTRARLAAYEFLNGS